jgi:hypothetical protein
MSKLVNHSQVSKQPGETGTISNSFLVDERMKGKCTRRNVPNGDTLASNGRSNGLLRNKLLNPNGDGGTSIFTPLFSVEGLTLDVRFASLLAQNNPIIRPVANGLSTKSSSLKDLQHGNNALANSTTLEVLHYDRSKEKLRRRSPSLSLWPVIDLIV